MIREEEKKLKDLKNELKIEIEKESIEKSFDLEKIKRSADVVDFLTDKEKNKVLKSCIEKVVIDGENIKVYFKI